MADEQSGFWPDLERRNLTRSEIQRRYYLRHRDEIRAKAALDPAGNRQRYEKFKAAHPERAREIKAKYAAAHREELNRKSADRLNAIRRADPEAARERERQRRQRNLEHYRAYERKWTREHPEQVIARTHRRRARKVAAGVFTVLPRDWRRMLHRYRYACAYCGRADLPLHQEHVIPLARGGRHAIGNLLPVCQSCNARKWMMLLVEWRGGKVITHPRVRRGRASRPA
jgi:hypothetical protein